MWYGEHGTASDPLSAVYLVRFTFTLVKQRFTTRHFHVKQRFTFTKVNRAQWTALRGSLSVPCSPYHTVDYEPFIKSHLASTQYTLEPAPVQIWSRYPRISGRTNESDPRLLHTQESNKTLQQSWKYLTGRTDYSRMGGSQHCFVAHCVRGLEDVAKVSSVCV